MTKSGFWLRRIYKLHLAFEELIEALLCDAVVYEPLEAMPEGGFRVRWYVRWWNPAAWIGWSRTRLFGDRFGHGLFCQGESK